MTYVLMWVSDCDNIVFVISTVYMYFILNLWIISNIKYEIIILLYQINIQG